MIDITKDIIQNCGSIIIHPKGRSMLPFIKEGECVTVSYLNTKAKKYDVVLYKSNGIYILHRIIGFEKDCYIICGDNSNIKEYIACSEILGKVLYFKRNGKTVYVNQGLFVFAAKAWYCLGIKKLAVKMKMIKRVLLNFKR